jgi:hypothetical protein
MKRQKSFVDTFNPRHDGRGVCIPLIERSSMAVSVVKMNHFLARLKRDSIESFSSQPKMWNNRGRRPEHSRNIMSMGLSMFLLVGGGGGKEVRAVPLPPPRVCSTVVIFLWARVSPHLTLLKIDSLFFVSLLVLRCTTHLLLAQSPFYVLESLHLFDTSADEGTSPIGI